MKIDGGDGQTTMKFVLSLFALNKYSKEISEKLDERDLQLLSLKSAEALPNLLENNKEEQREKSNFVFLKEKIKRGFKKVKRKIYPTQYELIFS